MNVTKVDARRRVVLKEADPGEVFQVEAQVKGEKYVLTRVESKAHRRLLGLFKGKIEFLDTPDHATDTASEWGDNQ